MRGNRAALRPPTTLRAPAPCALPAHPNRAHLARLCCLFYLWRIAPTQSESKRPPPARPPPQARDAPAPPWQQLPGWAARSPLPPPSRPLAVAPPAMNFPDEARPPPLSPSPRRPPPLLRQNTARDAVNHCIFAPTSTQVIALEELCEERGKELAQLDARAKLLEECAPSISPRRLPQPTPTPPAHPAAAGLIARPESAARIRRKPQPRRASSPASSSR